MASPTVVEAWDGTKLSELNYSDANISVTGISGGDSYVIQGKITPSDTWVTLSVINLNSLSSLTSITADGIYAVPVMPCIRYVKTGSASTPNINIELKG